MFIGHYGVSYAIKRASPRVPFWILLLAVQFVDLLFMVFIMIGVEKVRLIPGFTAYNPYDLFYMPYSHSLVAHVGWALLVGGICWPLFRKAAPRQANLMAILTGVAVFSHFPLDLLMHTPDLPLLFDSGPKFGLGLWHYRTPSMIAELICIGGGLLVYFRGSKPGPGFAGQYGLHFFAIFLLVLTVATPFLPPPETVIEFGLQALAGFGIIAALGGWLDRHRMWPETPGGAQ